MPRFERLTEIQHKSRRLILGLMSGTSIDGLDLALCAFSGSGSGCGSDVKFEILHHGTRSYTDEQQRVLRMLATQEMVRMEDVCIYHTELSRWHADMVLETLGEWGVDVGDVDLIASHGQTIRHAPKRIHGQDGLPNSTFQLGEPDHLAYLTGILTLSDFRQKHVAAGGEGAPLAGYGDQLLFRDASECRVLLNVGGISNITILNPAADVSALPVTFDTGPGNTLMDYVVRTHFSPMRFDDGGKIAAKGKISETLLFQLKSHEYFQQNPPKTTGPEAFSPEFLSDALKVSMTEHLSPTDILATLNRFTAETIADGIRSGIDLTNKSEMSAQDAKSASDQDTKSTESPYLTQNRTFKTETIQNSSTEDQTLFEITPINPRISSKKPVRVLISGGGAHNHTLVRNLAECLDEIPVEDFSSIGVHPDAKEALFFAAMANEFLCGNNFKVQREDGSYANVSFGKLSFPD